MCFLFSYFLFLLFLICYCVILCSGLFYYCVFSFFTIFLLFSFLLFLICYCVILCFEKSLCLFICLVFLQPIPIPSSPLSITNSQSSLKLMSIESVMPSNHLIVCRPLLFLPSVFPIRVFPMSQLFISGGQNNRASDSASVLSVHIQG